MKRKIVLILTAIIILSMPFQQTYMETEAAIVSKAAGATAKKIAKEVIQDSAINIAIKIASDEAKRLNDSSYKSKPGYMTFCMDYTYKPGDKCSKPSSIKADLTETDKANIKKQAGTELDKLIAPGGKGFSKWAKFLDWFIPIWLITFAVTAITYAIDPDVKNLFDEAAYNALVALGIISPVESEEIEPVKNFVPPEVDKDGKYIAPDGTTQSLVIGSTGVPKGDHNFNSTITSSGIKMENVLVRADFNLVDGAKLLGFEFGDYFSYASQWSFSQTKIKLGYLNGQGNLTNPITTIVVDGVTVFSGIPERTGNEFYISDYIFPEITSITQKQMKSIMQRTPYKIGDFYYTDMLFNTVDGNIIEIQTRSDTNYNPTMTRFTATLITNAPTWDSSASVRIFQNVKPNKRILVPNYDTLSPKDFNPTDESSYKDDKGNIALLPPAAFPYIEESTGDQVERIPAPTGDGYVWQKPDGTIVPEDNVIPKPEDEPQITPAPDGTPQYTPAPTPSNPNPEPVPLQPNPNAPPVDPPGTGESEPPLEPFPEGSKCDAKLKFPIFSPLKETLQTSFPFSIPWDIERAALAIFGGISNEKPNFKIAIPFLGETHEVHITIPKFMDDWKPFMDSFLLITFDLLLMFGLYRFVKGAGS